MAFGSSGSATTIRTLRRPRIGTIPAAFTTPRTHRRGGGPSTLRAARAIASATPSGERRSSHAIGKVHARSAAVRTPAAASASAPLPPMPATRVSGSPHASGDGGGFGRNKAHARASPSTRALRRAGGSSFAKPPTSFAQSARRASGTSPAAARARVASSASAASLGCSSQARASR